MNSEEKQEFKNLCRQVNEIHTTIFGVEQQGGLLRDHKDLKKDVSRLKEFSLKLLGGLIAISAVFSFVFNLIMKFTFREK